MGLLDFASSLGAFWAPDFGAGGAIQIPPPTPLESFSSGLVEVGRGVGDVAGKVGGAVGDFAGKVGAGLEQQVEKDPLGSFTKSLGLGATGFGLANQFRLSGQLNQQTQNVNRAQQAAQAAAPPAVAAGTADITRAQQGQLQPAMEPSIAQWTDKAKADLRARYAQMGLGNSSDIASAEAQIDQMALAMRGQLLQDEEKLGLSGVQTGVSAATGGAQISQNQQALLAQP